MQITGGGDTRVGYKVGPGRAVLRHLDPVAGDGSPPVIGGRRPRQVDLGSIYGRGHEPGGSVRHGGVGGGGRGVGRLARAQGVDGRNPVVPGGRGFEPRVRVVRVGVPGVGNEVAPRRTPVFGDFDAVPADAPAAIVCRRPPGKIDARRAIRRGGQRRGNTGNRGLRGCGRHPGRLADAHLVDRRDPVVTGGAGQQANVRVGGSGRPRRRHQDAPRPPAVVRNFDPVADEQHASGIGRGGP